MSTVTLSSKGQIVLPAKVRRRLGLAAGSRLDLVEESDGVRLRVARLVPATRVAEVVGMVSARSKGKPRKLHDFDASTLVRRPRR